MIYWGLGIGLFGLALDFYGVWGLFKSVPKSLESLRHLSVDHHLRRYGLTLFGRKNESIEPLKSAIGEVLKTINKQIEKTNDENQAIHKESKRYLVLILIGFALQAVSLTLTTLSK